MKTRRELLADTATLGAALALTPSGLAFAGGAPDIIDRLIEASRDRFGRPQIDRACGLALSAGAVVSDPSHPKALAVEPDAGRAIRAAFDALASGAPGKTALSVAGTRHVITSTDPDRGIIHTRGGGCGLSLRRVGDRVLVARCAPTQGHGLLSVALERVARDLEQSSV